MRRIDWTKEGRRLARDYAELLAGALVTALGFCYFFLSHDIACSQRRQASASAC